MYSLTPPVYLMRSFHSHPILAAATGQSSLRSMYFISHDQASILLSNCWTKQTPSQKSHFQAASMANPQTRQEIFSMMRKKDRETNYDYDTRNMAARLNWVQEEDNKYARTLPFMRGATTDDYFDYLYKLVEKDIDEEEHQLHEISQTTPPEFWKAVSNFRSIYYPFLRSSRSVMSCIRSQSMQLCSLH